ncbi:MAG: B12-binding domain-containing radical SAM protein [Betaproteobacteria bacterium]|nr:B12-binding domain-containing radical SAM protein [Betaproteobacteria bacterium]
MTILLTTLNARYAHSSLGLRYLHANMGKHADRTRILELVIGINSSTAAEKLLALNPAIICMSVYIWNAEESAKLVSILKTISPKTLIILGGPEISHETPSQPIAQMADYVISGWGEATLPDLCSQILDGIRPAEKFHKGQHLDLNDIVMPYHLYSDEDIANRTLYVEASRGCPFRCEFCLSSLDKTAWAFDTDRFLAEMEKLYARGARNFKFVDRTFNLNTKKCLQILHFFLDKIHAAPSDPVFVHFEVVPDHLPETLKEAIQAFPTGTLQLEIGVQTFNPDVQALISRKQDNHKTKENIQWLKNHSQAHLHTDLIIGLPGETIESFGKGFDRLVKLKPHEIQVGILKRLRGTPILRHTDTFGLVFNPTPPYAIMATTLIDFFTMQRLVRFARFWDLIANSGRFAKTLPFILADEPFSRFMALSDWLYDTGRTTHGIALDRLASLVAKWLITNGMDADLVRITLGQDYAGKAHMKRQQQTASPSLPNERRQAPVRQSRHIEPLTETAQHRR